MINITHSVKTKKRGKEKHTQVSPLEWGGEGVMVQKHQGRTGKNFKKRKKKKNVLFFFLIVWLKRLNVSSDHCPCNRDFQCHI